jgi:hypothetical protein
MTGLRRLGRTRQEVDVAYFKLLRRSSAEGTKKKARKVSFMLHSFRNIRNSFVPDVYEVGNEHTYGQLNLSGTV